MKELNAEVQNILAETDHVTVVSSEDVANRLAEERGRCPPRGKERTDCLERVALATHAVYIVAITVTRTGKEYELSGSIADADRVLLEQPEPVKVTDTGAVKPDAALKHELRKLLLENMKVAALPSDPRMRNPQIVQPNPNEPPPPFPPPEPAKPEMTTSTMRLASYFSAGIAVAFGVTSLALGLVANGMAKGLRVSTDGVLQDPNELQALGQSRSYANISLALGIVGGVALAAAGVMFFVFPGEEPKAVVAPVAFVGGGGGMVFSGRWP